MNHSTGIRRSTIQAFAYHVPERVVSNDELADRIDTSDEWIVSHTGIRQRHIAADDLASSDLALCASQKVLERSACSPGEIDLIVLATGTPDYNGFPATACVLQERLGCRNAAAFDITAACSGFIYSLEIARSMITGSSNYQKALVVGAEVFSKIVNWEDRSTCILFGDGAGAALLSAEDSSESSALSNTGINILDILLRADGSGAEKLWVPEGGSRMPYGSALNQATGSRRYIEMDGRGVYNFAVAANQEILHEMLQRNQLRLSDLRCIVPHQANLRIIQAVAKREEIPLELFYTNIERYANTSAASIPIALSELAASGSLQSGDLLLCIGFGAGLTYAGALFQWGQVKH